jgi:demethylmenaquinone methyltransferase/2-methoxy-6-polyprenyl-1,4-benzoquinol methylase
VAEAVSGRRSRALELFAPLGPTYDRYARLLSLGQDPRWRRFLVSRIDAGPGDRVLDVACGTGAVGLELTEQDRRDVEGAFPLGRARDVLPMI